MRLENTHGGPVAKKVLPAVVNQTRRVGTWTEAFPAHRIGHHSAVSQSIEVEYSFVLHIREEIDLPVNITPMRLIQDRRLGAIYGAPNLDIEGDQIGFGVFDEDLGAGGSAKPDGLTADIYGRHFGVEPGAPNHTAVIERHRTVREDKMGEAVRLGDKPCRGAASRSLFPSVSVRATTRTKSKDWNPHRAHEHAARNSRQLSHK